MKPGMCLRNVFNSAFHIAKMMRKLARRSSYLPAAHIPHLPDRGAQSVFHHLDTSVDRPIAKLRSLSDKPRRARDRTLRPY
jgi:hypothetical protein